MSTHTEREDEPWEVRIGDHAKRSDSATYREARRCMIRAVQLDQPWFYGDRPYQDHHGGGIWMKDSSGWLLVRNLAGIEWSAQFAAAPTKVELLRRNAERLVAGFPTTEAAYRQELGMSEDHLAILHTPVVDAAGVALWTDSFWNASVPLPAGFHTGVIGAKDGQQGGVHHYPTPITDIQFFKDDRFVLWVDSAAGRVAVLPVAPIGSADRRVRLAWAPVGVGFAGQRMGVEVHEHESGDRDTVFAADHPLSMAAFANLEDQNV